MRVPHPFKGGGRIRTKPTLGDMVSPPAPGKDGVRANEDKTRDEKKESSPTGYEKTKHCCAGNLQQAIANSAHSRMDGVLGLHCNDVRLPCQRALGISMGEPCRPSPSWIERGRCVLFRN